MVLSQNILKCIVLCYRVTFTKAVLTDRGTNLYYPLIPIQAKAILLQFVIQSHSKISFINKHK